MRRIVLPLILAVVFSTSLFAQVALQQIPPRTTSTPQATSDPQALAAAQTALTALGGATAIGQIQSWTFQATMSGGAANGAVTYTLDRQPPVLSIMTRTGTRRTVMVHSFFVPAVIGAILAKQAADPTYAIRQPSLGISNAISIGPSAAPIRQTWHLDGATNLPFHVDFRSPEEFGSRVTFPAEVYLSDYHNVGGVLYPFRIVTRLHSGLPEVITIQSVTTSTVAPTTPSAPISQAGDTL